MAIFQLSKDLAEKEADAISLFTDDRLSNIEHAHVLRHKRNRVCAWKAEKYFVGLSL